MPLTVAVIAALALLFAVAARSGDVVVRMCAALAWVGTGVAFLAVWATDYRWSEQLGCVVAYPEQLGYRAPELERLPGPVEDTQSWWPLGRQCSGVDSSTGQFVSIEPGWGLSVVVYSSLLCAVFAVVAVVVRLIVSRTRGARASVIRGS